MKKIAEHLGQIIIALAGIALLIGCIAFFKAPIGDFFGNIINKETAIGQEVLDNIEYNGVDVNGGEGGQVNRYTIIKGAGQMYTTGSLSFTSDAPFDKFAGVKVNDELVDPVNYTVEEGSTIITFTEEYSKVLAAGDYTIEVLATDGLAAAPFGVSAFEQQTTAFYVYTPKEEAGGWKLSLNSNFKTALKGNTDYVVDGETLWTVGSPLPNPGATYNGFPVIDLDQIFAYCSGVTSLDLSAWDTSNVTIMGRMFYGSFNLTSLNLSGWDTSNVTNMSYTFYSCNGLTSLNLSGWDTANVTDMSSMFASCWSLTSLNISGWDTANVTNMDTMFGGCKGLTSLNLAGWDTAKVNTLRYMFQNCSGLTSLDVSGWDTANVTNMFGVFSGCSKLTSLDLSGWDTSYVENMNNMFQNCSKLASITVANETVKTNIEASMNFPAGCTVTVK